MPAKAEIVIQNLKRICFFQMPNTSFPIADHPVCSLWEQNIKTCTVPDGLQCVLGAMV